MNIQYGSGSCSGILGTDTLTFGTSLKVPKQELGLATSSASTITSSGVDGILGMGPDGLSSSFNSGKWNNSYDLLIAYKSKITNIVRTTSWQGFEDPCLQHDVR